MRAERLIQPFGIFIFDLTQLMFFILYYYHHHSGRRNKNTCQSAALPTAQLHILENGCCAREAHGSLVPTELTFK